jgi:Uma2 family endonuclease
MGESALTYRLTPEEFARAWEAGAFSRRVELVDGEVWPVAIGGWHGRTTARLSRALPDDWFTVISESLVAGDSVTDPDCWVAPAGAEPVGRVGARLAVWRPADMLLVVEVGDEAVEQDLTVKARVYAQAGFAVYWVVTRDGIYEHTDPVGDGYRLRTHHRPGERIPVRYAGTDLAVDDVLAPTAPE